MKKPSHRKFRHFLIYPKFQLALLGMQSGVLSAVFGLIAWQMHRSYSHLHALGVQAGLGQTHAYFKFLDLQTRTAYWNLAVGVALAYVLSAALTLVLSHRLAGPIVRLRGYFREMAASDAPQLPELSFRKGDFFAELPVQINAGLRNWARTHASAPAPSSSQRKAG